MKLTILTAIALVLPLTIWAADIFDVKPGLWEYTATTTTELPNGQPAPALPQLTDEQLAKIPPAQRAQIEAVLKARGGPAGPRTSTGKSCITKETLAKALTFSQQGNSCTTKATSLTSSRQEIHIECTGQFKAAGDIIVERVDSEHSKANMQLKSEGDHPMTMKTVYTSKFVSADCGDVKPMGEK